MIFAWRRLGVALWAAVTLAVSSGSLAYAQEDGRPALEADYRAALEGRRYPEALSLAEERLRLAEKTYGSHDPFVATLLVDVGDCHYLLGELGQAERAYERSLAIREKALGPDDAEVARSVRKLARVFMDSGEWLKAAELYTRALEIFDRSIHPYSAELAIALEEYAGTLWALERHEEARVIGMRAKTIRLHVNDSSSP